MVNLRSLTVASAALLLSAASSSALVLPEAAVAEEVVLAPLLAFESLNFTLPVDQPSAAESQQLSKRQSNSGSETPLWYTGRTDPWASFRNFNWNTWINWGWTDHTLGYVK